MSVVYRRRVPLTKRLTLNLSKGAPSLSAKVTDRVTVTSKGRITVRGPRGWSWRVR